MPRKSTILANEENSNNSAKATEPFESIKLTCESDCESDDASKNIQAPKPKRQQTEKQKEATAKMRQRLAEKHAMIRAQKAKEAEETKKVVEEKVIKKAIAIKKKQIKQEKILDDISDDDTPIEEIIPTVRKPRPAPKVIPKQAVQQPSRQNQNGQRIIFV